MDMLSKTLADFNVGATREFTLKPEQELAVTALNDGKDILAVLPTGSWQKLDLPNTRHQVNRKFSSRYQ